MCIAAPQDAHAQPDSVYGCMHCLLPGLKSNNPYVHISQASRQSFKSAAKSASLHIQATACLPAPALSLYITPHAVAEPKLACSCTPTLCFCTGSACADAPPDDTPNSTGWPVTCAGTAVGRSCRAVCNTAAGATGTGYTARCIDMDVWRVTGTCTSEWIASRWDAMFATSRRHCTQPS
jgi:hypothetical protein